MDAPIKIILWHDDDSDEYVIDFGLADGTAWEHDRYQTRGKAIAFGEQEARRWSVPLVECVWPGHEKTIMEVAS